MRFLADMGIAPRIVAWLRQQGHEAHHLLEQGLQRLPDPEIFDKAIREHSTVLTFDLDFGEIVVEDSRHRIRRLPIRRSEKV
jgi:predicted nuclease of predicted toxin-antitoxin system